jgi:hypothetical protein
LKAVLEHSKSRLDGSAVTTAETGVVAHHSPGWGQRLFGGIRPLLWLLIISALLALLVLGRIERSRVPLPRNATREKL